jgi:allantoicase
MNGWETSRHGYRHRLGISLREPSRIQRLEIDTYMHCLNAFKFVIVLACDAQGESLSIVREREPWN